MDHPDPIAKQTLWWTRWQTWTGGLGLVLTVMLGWTIVKGILVAIWSGLSAGVRIPIWLVLVTVGTSIWLFIRLRAAAAVPAAPPVEVPKLLRQSEEAIVEEILWRWRPNRTHGRVGSLKPFCPHCDMELSWNQDPGTWQVLDRWTSTLYCPRCPDTDWSFEGKANQVIDLTRKAIEAGLREEDKKEAARG